MPRRGPRFAEEDKYDIGLIDAHTDPVLLPKPVADCAPNLPLTTWPMGQRLWMFLARAGWRTQAGRGSASRTYGAP